MRGWTSAWSCSSNGVSKTNARTGGIATRTGSSKLIVGSSGQASVTIEAVSEKKIETWQMILKRSSPGSMYGCKEQ